MNAYLLLQHAHSINRWLVLVFMLWAIASAFSSRSSMNVADATVDGRSVLPKGALPAFITTHVQLLLGLVLYVGGIAGVESLGSPYVIMDKDVWEAAGGEIVRFYSVTHMSYTLPAIVLVTVGYVVAKRSSTSARAGLWVLVTYVAALVLLIIGIPWPGRGLAGGWW